MRKVNFKHNWTIMLMLAFLASPVVAVASPHFSLVPASGSLNVGDQITVKVAVTTETEKSQAMDVWATFDPAKFEVVSIIKAVDAPSNYTYEMTPHIDNVTGRFDIPFSSTVMSDLDATPVIGNLATITFKAKASGTVAVNFTCVQSDTRDTNIFRSGTSTDIVVCSANQGGSYTVNSGSSDGGTPLPTSTPIVSNPGSTATPTPTAVLPQAGNLGATIGVMALGLVMIVSGLMFKIF